MTLGASIFLVVVGAALMAVPDATTRVDLDTTGAIVMAIGGVGALVSVAVEAWRDRRHGSRHT